MSNTKAIVTHEPSVGEGGVNYLKIQVVTPEGYVVAELFVDVLEVR